MYKLRCHDPRGRPDTSGAAQPQNDPCVYTPCAGRCTAACGARGQPPANHRCSTNSTTTQHKPSNFHHQPRPPTHPPTTTRVTPPRAAFSTNTCLLHVAAAATQQPNTTRWPTTTTPLTVRSTTYSYTCSNKPAPTCLHSAAVPPKNSSNYTGASASTATKARPFCRQGSHAAQIPHRMLCRAVNIPPRQQPQP